MKKIKYLLLTLMTAAAIVCLAGCATRTNDNPGTQNQNTTGGTAIPETSAGNGTVNQGTSGYSSTNGIETQGNEAATDGSRLNENGMNGTSGAGTTGSTEGETGVINGLIRDAEDGVNDLIDDGTNRNRNQGAGTTAAPNGR